MPSRHVPHQDRSLSAVIAAALGLCLLAGVVAVTAIVTAPARWAVLAGVATIAVAACLTATAIVSNRGARPRRAHSTHISPAHNDRSE